MLICGLAIYHTALKYTLSMVKWNVVIQTVLQSDIFILTVLAEYLQISFVAKSEQNEMITS